MASTTEATSYAGQAHASQDAKLSSLYKDSKASLTTFRTFIEGANAHPSSGSIEYHRKELRNNYLKMLFHFTFAGRTRGIEGSIWMETTHPLVHLYRSHLSLLESKIRTLKESKPSSNGDGERATQQGGQKKKANQAHHQLAQLTQSHAKLLVNFRAFLVKEEGFWRDLAGRLAQLYNVQDAVPNLRALHILSDAGEQEVSATGIDRIIGLEGLTPESRAQARLPSSRTRLVEIIHKSLIYCGDLARYIVLYGEDTHEQKFPLTPSFRGSSRGRGRGRGGFGRDSVPFVSHQDSKPPKDFKRAADCYEQARHLLPSNGNPWNQLAVLATYRGDNFVFIYDSYRALCVSEPFDKAKGNMEKTLRKILIKWLEQGHLKAFSDDVEDAHHDENAASVTKNVSFTSLSRDLVVLHSAYFLRHQATMSSRFPVRCINDIYILLQRKALPTDAIVQITVTAIAALWLRRLWRANSPTSKDSGTASSLAAEQSILFHLCSLIQTMFDLGANEAIESIAYSNEQAEQGDVQDIPAVLRRMLPAIRIVSKWLKAHLEYIAKSRQQSALSPTTLSDQTEPATAKTHVQTSLGIDGVWNSYANFINAVRFAYPFDSLPNLGISVGQSGMSGIDFEEDRDMRGFSPMKKSALLDAGTELQSKAALPSVRPKEEHLIRIADILVDAKVIAETDASPIHFDDNKSSFYFARPTSSHLDSRAFGGAPLNQEESASKTKDVKADQRSQRAASADEESFDASESSEDAVDLAMRAVDERRQALASESISTLRAGGDEEQEQEGDDEEEIILIPSMRQQIISTDTTTGPDPFKSSHSPAQGSASHADPLNAQHLLLQVLNGSPRSAASTIAHSDAGRVPAMATGASSKPLPITGFPAASTFGPIGTPLPRATPSPHTFPQPPLGSVGAMAWGNATEGGLTNQHNQHRTDIWAPQPSSSALAQHATPVGTADAGWPTPGTFPSSGLRDWVGTTTASSPHRPSNEERHQKRQSASGQQW